MTQTQMATKAFASRDLAWSWLEAKFGVNGGAASIAALFFDRVNPEQSLRPGTIFNTTGSRGTKRQARLDAWDSKRGRCLLSFLDLEGEPWRTHEYTLISDGKEDSCRMNLEIKFYYPFRFWSLVAHCLGRFFGKKNILAKGDLNLPVD